MILYHTDPSLGGSVLGGAPTIDLTAINVTPYYNTAIPRHTTSPLCGNGSPSVLPDDYVCQDVLLNQRHLHAREKEGLFLLEYDDKSDNHFLGFDIVQVKKDQPEGLPIAVDIGSRLHPSLEPCDADAHLRGQPCPDMHLQKRQGTPREQNNQFIYQHSVDFSPQRARSGQSRRTAWART